MASFLDFPAQHAVFTVIDNKYRLSCLCVHSLLFETMLLKKIDFYNIKPYIKSNKQYAEHKRPQ